MKNIVRCNYKLLDCGEYEKLEQVDEFIIRRPAPQANWKRKLGIEIWENYSARYEPKQAKWRIITDKKLPDFVFNDISFNLKLSPNGQIGIFPEQMVNWLWLEDIVENSNREIHILNGFAYTGAATLIASTPTNSVTHIDAASSSVNWAKKNAKLCGKENLSIRWIIDDIRTFLKREQKRGVRYDGIILDPPAFGRSKKGGIWKISRDLPELMKFVNDLLTTSPEFIILSCHDKNFDKPELKKQLMQLKNINGEIETLDLVIKSEYGNDLAAGKCARWRRI
ncbi:MAG: class I SAM-dependent methyltransferase [Candidatus Stygibacter australis]|nr:class I SAM-dependent methyltransferase [Candidatus Stygibacter australis]